MIKLQMNKQLVKQVAKVIGKKLAKHELSIVYAARLPCATDSSVIAHAFTWRKTPQGARFWVDIRRGRWPYSYERGERR
jgi:hypothetical protein